MASVDAVVDLLGVLAYGELSGFDHLVDDARLAPELTSRVAMSDVAASDYANYQRLVARLGALGADPFAAMTPFVAALEGYHALTAPSTWLEAVMKAYLGDGLAGDFYREVAAFADGETAALIDDVLRASDRAELAVAEVRGAIVIDPSVAGRLALWGRRLVGEAISQTQHVLAERDSLMLLLVEGTGDVAGTAGLITRITERHEKRMELLGFTPG